VRQDSPAGKAATGDRYKLEGSAATNSGLTIPTMLTLLRVAVIPVLVALYFRPEPWVPAACAGIFLVAAITDWLDGYLARKWDQASAFGAFLDPVRILALRCVHPCPRWARFPLRGVNTFTRLSSPPPARWLLQTESASHHDHPSPPCTRPAPPAPSPSPRARWLPQRAVFDGRE
jgi:hypothetical protein